MKYIFIDTEHDTIRKSIYSLGYYITDENFNEIDKENILLDTNKDLREIRKGFKKDLPFYQAYDKIANLLQDQNSLLVGWAAENDVIIILEECRRTVVPPLDFKIFDFQRAHKKVSGRDYTLEDAVKEYQIKDHFEFHNSLDDAKATCAVVREFCKENKINFMDFVKSNEAAFLAIKKGQRQWQNEDKKETYEKNKAALFSVSLDLPVIKIIKNMGVINENLQRDGVALYYNILMKKCFYDGEHPWKIASAIHSYLNGHRIYKDVNVKKEMWKSIEKKYSKFYKSKGNVRLFEQIVSFDFCISCKDEKCEVVFSKKTIREHLQKKTLIDSLEEKDVDRIKDFIIEEYYQEKFVEEVLKGRKWCFGEKEKNIAFDNINTYDYQDIIEKDEIYLPRLFWYVLTGKTEKCKYIACRKDLIEYAKADKVIEIEQNDENNYELIIMNDKNECFAFEPCKIRLSFGEFCETFKEIPFLLKRRIDNYFEKL